MHQLPHLGSSERVNFQYKDLAGKDLSRTCLANAQFQHANLAGTFFAHSDLSYACFRDPHAEPSEKVGEAKGLTCNSFPGCDLNGAILPEYANNFPQLKALEDGAKDGAKMLFTVVAVSIFSLLTSGVFTDASLLTNGTLASAIPALGLTLPVKPFVLVAPFLLLSLHIYFLVALQHYEEVLSTLPRVFPDGTRLKHKVYPWSFSSFPALFGKQRPCFSDVITCAIAFVLAGLLVPLSIWIIWFRALCLHDFAVYSTLLALGMAFVASIIKFSWSRQRFGCWTAPGEPKISRFPKWMIACLAFSAALFAIGLGITIQAEFGAVVAPLGYAPVGQAHKHPPALQAIKQGIGYFQVAQVGDADLAKKPSNWSGYQSADERELKSVIGADLSWRNLRFLRGFRCFLVRSQLNSSDLTGAVLSQGDLRGSDLRDANLMRADLTWALVSSFATPTKMDFAHLQGADLTYSILRGASLQNAQVSGAIFKGADLSGTDLRGSDVTEDQVADAGYISYDTKFDSRISTTICKNPRTRYLSIRLNRSTQPSKWFGVAEPDESQSSDLHEKWQREFDKSQDCKDIK